MPQPQAELVLDAHAELGEGALWDGRVQRLLWVDIVGQKLHVFDPRSGQDQSFPLSTTVGTVVPRASGGLVLALGHDIASFDPASAKLKTLASVEPGRPLNRFNDGKCDPAGRFWAGTMANVDRKGGEGALYCFDARQQLSLKVPDVSCSNGLVWTRDAQTFYYIDTPLGRVDAFDYDLASGAISRRRVAVTVDPALGHPDGMTIDAEDKLWVAMWGGAQVCRFDPASGRLLQSIQLPVSRVTSCAFGGPDLDQLYITTASTGLDAEGWKKEPHAGGLFVVKALGVKGVPAFEYAG